MPPPPSGAGGYEFEVVQPGPPTYFTPPPAVTARGGLIPVGDGEGLVARPAPPPGRRRAGSTKRRRLAAGTPRQFDTALEERVWSLDDATLNFEAYLQLGLTRHALMDHASAGSILEQAVVVARRVGDRRMTAMALHSLSIVLRDIGRYESAIEMTAEVVSLAEDLGDKRVLARALVSYGSLLRQLGRFEEAVAALERAVATVGVF
jgi:tetratricopeptide (TPR) repeat protein